MSEQGEMFPRPLKRSLFTPGAVLLEDVPRGFARVAEAMQAGDDDLVRAILGELDRDLILRYWDGAGVTYNEVRDKAVYDRAILERDARNRAEGRAGKVRRRSPSRAVLAGVAKRDGWRCRYCGLPLLCKEFLRALAARFPVEFPWVREGKGADAKTHPACIVYLFVHDHVVPLSFDGADDETNLVSSCGTCNYWKWHYTLEVLALSYPRDRDPVVDAWDGMSGYSWPAAGR